MPSPSPSLPIPEPLRGNELGTWAEESVKVRMPDIARRAVREQDWPEAIADGLSRLADEIPRGEIELIGDPGAPDAEAWVGIVASYRGMTWLAVPWFFAEAYFYRRLLTVSGYFRIGPTRGLDPFGPEKRRGLAQGLKRKRPVEGADNLAALMLSALWGNRADMSLWPTQPGQSEEPPADKGAMSRLLVDDRLDALSHLEDRPSGPGRIDVVLDNAGRELLSDLRLVRGLLDTWPDCRLVLHVKAYPTFVSDATEDDLDLTLAEADSADGPLAATARALETARNVGRVLVASHAFWTSPGAGWEMPDELREDLGRSDLVIFKGDANYRRILGDRHWPFTTPFEHITSYFPAPLLCLRSLKADVAAGLDPGEIERAASADPDWMINGQWAMIQFSRGN